MLEEQIIELMLSKKYKPMSESELVGCFPNYDEEEVLNTIRSMQQNYKIVKTKSDNLILASKKGLFTGVVTGVFDEHVYVKIDKYEKDLKIEKRKSEIILPKDVVLLHLAEDETIEKVLERPVKVLVGEIKTVEVKEGKYEYYIIPQSKKINLTLKLEPSQCKDLVNGHKVVYELTSDKLGTYPVIKEVIGYKDDPNVDIKAYLLEAEAPIEFSEACTREANAVSREVNEEDLKEE